VDFALFGPVDAVDGLSQSIRVLGQEFSLPADLAGIAISGLAVGQTVSVEAAALDSGLTVLALEVLEEFSGPGASKVMVFGDVTAIDQSTGQLSIASVYLDANSATLYGSSPAAGQALLVSGTQPVLGGLILAETITGFGSQLSQSEIEGLRSISGSSKR
jgi:hypothetical protein